MEFIVILKENRRKSKRQKLKKTKTMVEQHKLNETRKIKFDGKR